MRGGKMIHQRLESSEEEINDAKRTVSSFVSANNMSEPRLSTYVLSIT